MQDEQVTAIGLAVVYFAMGVLGLLLARVERSAALRLWSYALFFFAVDEAAAAGFHSWHITVFQLTSWTTLVAGGILALAGTFRLLGKRLAKAPIAILLGALALSLLGGLLGFNEFYLRCCVFVALALPFFWAAKLFWGIDAAPGIGHRLSSFAFALIGVYALTWPYVACVATLKRFEFFLDLTVVMWSVAGVCLFHFERGRARIQALAQQELELRAKLETSERLEALGRLAGGVAHDFNNVLTTVIHGSELVLRQIEDRPKAAEQLRLVLESAQGAALFTRQLLTLGRRRLPGRKPIPVAAAVSSALKMVKPNLRPGISLNLTLPDVPIVVNSAEGQLEQIVVNLALNALDAMPDGGTLEVTLQFETESQQLKLRVSDTGQGIAKEVLPRIFEPFFSTKNGQGGTGLGLAAVYAIVKQLEGQIEVESTVGKQSVFTVTVPATMSTPAVLRTTASSIVPYTISILVVDDQPAVLRSIANGLAEAGFSITVANGAAEAIERASETRFSLLLTDLCMPEMDGFALVQRLRMKEPGLPAIIMTAHSSDSEADSGRYDVKWLPKPFTTAELRTAIDGALKASSLCAVS